MHTMLSLFPKSQSAMNINHHHRHNNKSSHSLKSSQERNLLLEKQLNFLLHSKNGLNEFWAVESKKKNEMH